MSGIGIKRFVVGAAALGASAVLLAACASGSSNKAGSSGSASTNGLKTESTSIGTVAADPNGMTIYELVGNTTATPTCNADCLKIWPAVTVGGTQVVLQGHPAFTFTMDTKAGDVTGQGVTDQWGTWYALSSDGSPIMTAVPSGAASGSASSSSGGGGGYGY